MTFETISVIGLGYIGLPTAAVIASRKTPVIGVDINSESVDTINQGNIHIVEPELDILVRSVVTQGYLRATTRPEPADAFLITVPSPIEDNHHPDLSFIKAASLSIAPVLKAGDLVILESTSPVGTTEQMAVWLAEARPDLSFPQDRGEDSDIRIAHCPERVLPGHIVRELVENDRLIGGMTKRCAEAASGLYKLFVSAKCTTTDVRTAEMAKLAENSFRDINIAYANELSIICEKLGINVWELIRLANLHPRVQILNPGPGVGGHCIAVDPWFIVSQAPEEARLIRTGREVNDYKPEWVQQKISAVIGEFLLQHPGKSTKEMTVVFLGLAFKADIDDLRESPAMKIVSEFAGKFPGNILVVEPNISELPQSLVGKCQLEDLDRATREADISVLLVAHTAFRDKAESIRQRAVTIDTVGIFEGSN